MTGMKTGAGDNIWGEDDEEETDEDVESMDEPTDGQDANVDAETEQDPAPSTTDDSSAPAADLGASQAAGTNPSNQQPYIVRRAIQDKSVQYERDERLTFFVHDDVVEGERELLQELESALGRDVPKFDVREAVYRAALNNREDVLTELIRMGYSAEQ